MKFEIAVAGRRWPTCVGHVRSSLAIHAVWLTTSGRRGASSAGQATTSSSSGCLRPPAQAIAIASHPSWHACVGPRLEDDIEHEADLSRSGLTRWSLPRSGCRRHRAGALGRLPSSCCYPPRPRRTLSRAARSVLLSYVDGFDAIWGVL